MLIACECAEKCMENRWPLACVLIALVVAGAFSIWALCKYS